MQLEALTPMTVTINGDWLPLPNRVWRGRATAPAPFVTMMFISSGGVILWTKSQRMECEGEVRLLLGNYDADLLDVQVNFDMEGSATVGRCVVSSPNYLPEVVPRQEFRCGGIETFTKIDGVPAVDVSILFIAKIDAKSARNRLWHLRPDLASTIGNPQFRRMLTYGRTGQLRE